MIAATAVLALDICTYRRGGLRSLVGPGKLARVNLHEQGREDVQRILAAYGPWLTRFRGCLDQAVQESGGYWEAPERPDFAAIDPCVRTGHVRTLAAAVAKGWPARKGSPRLKVGSFCAVHLYTQEGQRIRTRTRPRSRKTRQPMRAPKMEWASAPPLWGHDPSAQPYEISVLLEIDLGTKTLYMASLAAIDWGDDDKGREIYYEEEIPPPAVAGFDDPDPKASPDESLRSSSLLDDDFKDLLGSGEGVAETDPA